MRIIKQLHLLGLMVIIGLQNSILLAQSEQIEIPIGTSIIVDGKISEDEWKDALVENLRGGGQIKIKHDGAFLQIGLSGNQAGLSQVYLTNGQFVYVLHSSASLGMAVYQQENEVWQPIKKLKLELLGQPANNEATLSYLKTNNWLANVSSSYATEREYRIGAKFRDGDNFRMAAVYVSNPKSPQVFPKTLFDDTSKFELLYGSQPKKLLFKTGQWVILKLKHLSTKLEN